MKNPKTFVVKIAMPKGDTYKHRVLAESKWHAIDKAFNLFSSRQGDRRKYICN